MRARDVLDGAGYMPVETPTLEKLDVLLQGGTLDAMPFRLFDTDDELLVLRPDVTLPIARLVATRMGHDELPLRLRYVEPVFREEEALKGATREFTQIGIEAIGLDGAKADAEVISLLISTLEAAGLGEFTVVLCTVGVLKELLDKCENDCGTDAQWSSAVLTACHKTDFVSIERLARDARMDARHTDALIGLTALSGGGEAIDECKDITTPFGCNDGLSQLADTWDILASKGYERHLRIDFSVMSAFDYYTGVVFETYAPGVGRSLGGGGRYDHMLEAFGKKAPAAGFAISLERVMQALFIQGVKHADKGGDAHE
jgi:ATP phosphoribosyltransferase regulatory subunit